MPGATVPTKDGRLCCDCPTEPPRLSSKTTAKSYASRMIGENAPVEQALSEVRPDEGQDLEPLIQVPPRGLWRTSGRARWPTTSPRIAAANW